MLPTSSVLHHIFRSWQLTWDGNSLCCAGLLNKSSQHVIWQVSSIQAFPVCFMALPFYSQLQPAVLPCQGLLQTPLGLTCSKSCCLLHSIECQCTASATRLICTFKLPAVLPCHYLLQSPLSHHILQSPLGFDLQQHLALVMEHCVSAQEMQHGTASCSALSGSSVTR